MKKQTMIKAALASTSLISCVAFADINAGCIETYTDCNKVEIESVGLVDVNTCKYNPNALAPADDAGAVQCEFNVTYKCDSAEKTSVVISPARFGCAVK